MAVRPRRGSAAVCSRCHLPAPGYDQLGERRFEFIPLWGFLVFPVTLHMFRRGFATLAHPSGGTLRDIQEQLRHASAATTANVYVQTVPASVRGTVEKMDRSLRKKAKAAKQKV